MIIEIPEEYWNFAPDEAMLYAVRRVNPAMLEYSINDVRHIKRGTSAVIAALAVALLTVGCASQGGGDAVDVQANRCPKNTTLRCFKRTPEPEQCSCVSRQKIEDLLE